MSSDSQSDSEFMKAAALGSGVFLVVFLYLFGQLIKQDAEIVEFFNAFRPFTFAAVGLALGYHFGDAFRRGATDLKLFYTGGFATAALILANIHAGDVYTSVPFHPPVSSMILAAAAAAGFLHISPITEKYGEIRHLSWLISNRAAKIYLLVLVTLKYGLSFALFFIEKTPYEGIEAMAATYIMILCTVGVVSQLFIQYSSKIGQGSDTTAT